MENILKHADQIVNDRSEEKDRQYGPFSECINRTARIYNAMSYEHVLTGIDVFKVLIALKFAREAYAHKEDNLLDAAAYIGALNNYIEENKLNNLKL